MRPMMNLTLSFDHRVVDGHTAVGFLQAVKRALEAMGPETAVY
ncbi:MAG: 2-oxo acid dehydrogenase subunit E2 [Chloroflexota bacterium]